MSVRERGRSHRADAWGAVLLALPALGWAQGFPVKPVRYVIPFGPGAGNDLVGRVIADRLTKLWGQQVIVDNRAGAAGMLGTAFVAKSPPDGYTLLHCNIGPSAISGQLHHKPPYDQLRDFAPITRIGLSANVITVHPSVPLRTVQEYIGYARRQPGKLSYAAGQAGTSPHLSMELLKLRMKFDVVHIPYKIAAQGVTDTIGGQVPSSIYNLPSVIAPIQSGRLRALAVTTAQRSPALPAVPTVQESGVPDFDVSAWYGACAPAGTPTALLDKLHADFTAVLRTPEVEQKLVELVMSPAPTSREGFERFIRAEIARWGEVIRDAKIPKE